MNTKQRFDALVMDIEARAKIPYKKANEIVTELAAAQGIGSRDLNAVFQYITGQTIQGYVRERKLMASYQCLVESKKRSLQSAIVISGLESESSFSKKISAVFGMPPGEAARKKDRTLLTAPTTWDVAAAGDVKIKPKKEKVAERQEKTKFGLPIKQYERIMKAHELEELYEFSPAYSCVAFELSEQLNWSLEDAFSYMDDVRTFLAPFWEQQISDNTESADDVDELRTIAYDPYFLYMYTKCGVSVEMAAILLETDGLPDKETVMKQDRQLIRQYISLYPNIQYTYLKAAYEYYAIHADSSYTEENYTEYIDWICCGVPKEYAFERLLPAGDMDIDPCDPEEEEDWGKYDSIENMAEEEALWKNIRIDLEPDEENLAYEIDDADDPGLFDF